ncbi:lysosomal-associated transmembrane protein 5-like [Patiria miniata]|uniref:Lysosomal-associated transmembrane protein 4B n=1 Tax=Patiria miniata TaxID=46514 RepID=A0A914BKL1_PATMI|nr:lysosomal-associated transmembrane protein 5-like [Patiria miniata]
MAIMHTCCCCNVRVGSIVVAVYTVIVSAAALIQSAKSWAGEDSIGTTPSVTLTATWGASIGVNSLLLIAAACLILGIFKDAKALLVPYMVVQSLYMLIYVVLEIAIIVVLVNGNYIYFNFLNLDAGSFSDLDFAIVKDVLIGLAVGVPIVLGIDLLCLLCVISQYQELRDGCGRRGHSAPVVVIQQPGYSTGFAPATYDPRPAPQQQYYSKC